MTPERAKQLAEDNGCTFEQVGVGRHDVYKIVRSPDNWVYITGGTLNSVSDAQFIGFYIPDKRD